MSAPKADSYRSGTDDCVKRFLVIVFALMLSACQINDVNAPVTNAGDRSKYHIVRKGDTLYSIAWKYGRDYKSLARANKIAAPYIIFVGQKLSIRGVRSAPASSTSKPKKRVAKSPAKSGAPVPLNSNLNWQWPLRGEILKGFSLAGKVNKGINIAAKAGTGIRAAADGVVVYAGGNLRGYGKLVIVKHNNHYLSAYGNNRTIRVKEGAQVKSGQVLAEVGSSNAKVEMLHFEIRKDGKPVNPIRYLPSL